MSDLYQENKSVNLPCKLSLHFRSKLSLINVKQKDFKYSDFLVRSLCIFFFCSKNYHWKSSRWFHLVVITFQDTIMTPSFWCYSKCTFCRSNVSVLHFLRFWSRPHKQSPALLTRVIQWEFCWLFCVILTSVKLRVAATDQSFFGNVQNHTAGQCKSLQATLVLMLLQPAGWEETNSRD